MAEKSAELCLPAARTSWFYVITLPQRGHDCTSSGVNRIDALRAGRHWLQRIRQILKLMREPEEWGNTVPKKKVEWSGMVAMAAGGELTTAQRNWDDPQNLLSPPPPRAPHWAF